MPHVPVPPEVDAFLARPNPAVVATVRPDGSPHTAATWYVWEDGRVLLNMEDTRLRLGYMRANPQVVAQIGTRRVPATGRIVSRGDADTGKDARVFDTSIGSETGVTESAIQGPIRMKGWSYSCTADCQSSAVGCNGLAPTCTFWLGHDDCTGDPLHSAASQTLFTTSQKQDFTRLPGLALGAGEQLCVTTKDTANAIVRGWGEVPGPDADTLSRRVIFDETVPIVSESVDQIVTGPINLTWSYDCSAGCASGFTGCKDLTPACHIWLSRQDCTDAAPGEFDFADLFPAGFARSPGAYNNLPLAKGESICVSTVDSGTSKIIGWGERPK